MHLRSDEPVYALRSRDSSMRDSPRMAVEDLHRETWGFGGDGMIPADPDHPPCIHTHKAGTAPRSPLVVRNWPLASSGAGRRLRECWASSALSP